MINWIHPQKWLSKWYSIPNTGTMSSCGIAMPWQCGTYNDEAHESTNLDTINQLAIDLMHSYSSNTVKCLETQLEQLDFFPCQAHPVVQLFYLANLKESQSPYSRTAYLVFERCHAADRATKTWLRIAVIAGTIALPILGYFVSTQESTEAVAVAAVTIAGLNNLIAWIATGSNPDFKSDSNNDRQNELNHLPPLFEKMAYTLIQLQRGNAPLAQYLATQLQTTDLQSAFLRDDKRRADSREIMDIAALEAAREYVSTGTLSPATEQRAPIAILNSIAIDRLCPARQNGADELTIEQPCE